MVRENHSPSSTSQPQIYYGYIVVISAICIMMLAFGLYSSFGVFIQPMLNEFGWNRATISGAFSLSLVIHGFAGIGAGGLNDRFGPRLVLSIGAILLSGGCMLMSRVSSLWDFYLFYSVVVGTGMCCFIVPLMSTIAKWFTRRRTIMGGLVMAGSGLGALAGPLVSNWLISAYDWRTAYFIIGIGLFILLISVTQLLRSNPAQMGLRPYGEHSEVAIQADTNDRAFTLKEALRTREFWLACMILVGVSFIGWSITVHLAPHARELGMTAATAANILATMGGMMAVGMVTIGALGERLGIKWMLAIGFALTALALFWLVSGTEVWELYLFAVVFGIIHRLGLLVSPLLAELFGLPSHGVIYGVSGLGITVGAGLGPLLTGYIFDTTGSYNFAFLICAIVSILTAVSALLLRKTILGDTSCVTGTD